MPRRGVSSFGLGRLNLDSDEESDQFTEETIAGVPTFTGNLDFSSYVEKFETTKEEENPAPNPPLKRKIPLEPSQILPIKKQRKERAVTPNPHVHLIAALRALADFATGLAKSLENEKKNVACENIVSALSEKVEKIKDLSIANVKAQLAPPQLQPILPTRVCNIKFTSFFDDRAYLISPSNVIEVLQDEWVSPIRVTSTFGTHGKGQFLLNRDGKKILVRKGSSLDGRRYRYCQVGAEISFTIPDIYQCCPHSTPHEDVILCPICEKECDGSCFVRARENKILPDLKAYFAEVLRHTIKELLGMKNSGSVHGRGQAKFFTRADVVFSSLPKLIQEKDDQTKWCATYHHKFELDYLLGTGQWNIRQRRSMDRPVQIQFSGTGLRLKVRLVKLLDFHGKRISVELSEKAVEIQIHFHRMQLAENTI